MKVQHAGKNVPLSNAILTSSIRSLNPETLYSPSELRPAMNILTRLKSVLILVSFYPVLFFFFSPQVLHLREKKQTSFKSLIRLSFQNEISPWPFNPDPCISCLVKSALNYVYANDFRAEETY